MWSNEVKLPDYIVLRIESKVYGIYSILPTWTRLMILIMLRFLFL